MKPPELSVFQMSILHALPEEDEEIKFDDLRVALRTLGYRKSAPGFSNAMQRLQKLGFVAGRYESTQINGHTVREKYFKITREGVGALNLAQSFLKETLLQGKKITGILKEFSLVFDR